MSDKDLNLWQELNNQLKFWLAKFTIWYCGIPFIYWISPDEWEEYMKDE